MRWVKFRITCRFLYIIFFCVWNGFSLLAQICMSLASPIYVWRNGMWGKTNRRNLKISIWLCSHHINCMQIQIKQILCEWLIQSSIKNLLLTHSSFPLAAVWRCDGSWGPDDWPDFLFSDFLSPPIRIPRTKMDRPPPPSSWLVKFP